MILSSFLTTWLINESKSDFEKTSKSDFRSEGVTYGIRSEGVTSGVRVRE